MFTDFKGNLIRELDSRNSWKLKFDNRIRFKKFLGISPEFHPQEIPEKFS